MLKLGQTVPNAVLLQREGATLTIDHKSQTYGESKSTISSISERELIAYDPKVDKKGYRRTKERSKLNVGKLVTPDLDNHNNYIIPTLNKDVLNNWLKKLKEYEYIDKIGEYFNWINKRKENHYENLVGLDCCFGFCIIVLIGAHHFDIRERGRKKYLKNIDDAFYNIIVKSYKMVKINPGMFGYIYNNNMAIPIIIVYFTGSSHHAVVVSKKYIFDDTYGRIDKININDFILKYSFKKIIGMYTLIKKQNKIKYKIEPFHLKLNNYCIGLHSDGKEYIGILKTIDPLKFGCIKMINYDGVIGVEKIRAIDKYDFLFIQFPASTAWLPINTA